MATKCDLCGQRVRIYSREEGTNSYIGVEAEELERLKVRVEDAFEKQVKILAKRLWIAQDRIRELESEHDLV